MSARLPRKLTVLLLSAGLVLLAVSVYLEITELDLLQRHPILVNLLSGAVGFCFGVVALSAAEFVPPLIDGTVEAVVAAARSWIDEVEASSYHAAFVTTAAAHIDRLAQQKNMAACISAVEAMNDLLYQCVEPYLWEGGIGFNH